MRSKMRQRAEAWSKLLTQHNMQQAMGKCTLPAFALLGLLDVGGNGLG